jgi:diguanylate cyclase (GGDEF)-like protein
MKGRKFISIRKRIAALVAACVLLSVTTIATMLAISQVNIAIENKKTELNATGYVYAAAVADPLMASEKSKALSVLSSISRVPGILFAVVLDARNQSFASMGSAVFLADDIAKTNMSRFAMLKKGILPVAVDIVRGGEHVGKLVLIADIKPMRTALFWTVAVIAMSALLSSVLGVAIAAPLLRRITAPILSLTQATQHIRTARDYTTQVESTSNDETGILVDSFNSMIAEIRLRDASLEKLAYFDPLTGLSNRPHFYGLIDEMLINSKETGSIAALFIIDLDDFQQLNDTFGLSIGDALLLSVTDALRRELDPKFMIARLGADEFAIGCNGVASEQDSQELLAPFIASLYKPIKIMEHDIHVTVSIGGVLMPRDGDTPGDLLRRGHLALHDAKRRGTSQLCFYKPDMDVAVQEQAEIAKGLRRSIADNEFEAYFQPQLNLMDGSISSFESLIRWNHPERGLISPAQFISVAEETGLISSVGNWMLRNSCAQGKMWLDKGIPPRKISVNVSAAQIMQARFFDEVVDALSETGLPPSLLCLELTESLFVGQSFDRVSRLLVDLKKLGVSLAIDDFGTGYSSLSYLEKLPFDILKIDRSFVSGVDFDGKKRELLKGIISLAHALSLQVVAEGAETEGELQELRNLSVDCVQGYVISRPLPAKDVLEAVRLIEQRFHTPTYFNDAQRA